MADPFLAELKQLLKTILTDEDTRRKLDETNDLKQIYDILKTNGFSGDYEDFKKSMSRIFKISEEKMEQIAGGVATNPPLRKLLATVMTSMTLCGPIIAAPNASAVEDITSPTFVSTTLNANDFSDSSGEMDESESLAENIKKFFPYMRITSTEARKSGGIPTHLYNCLWNKLDENEIENLENVLPDNNLINTDYEEWKREMCKGLKVDYKSLNSLISDIINSKGDTNSEQTISFSLCNGNNIYNIQKRFVFSIILNELSRRNPDLYPTYFKMGEEVNKDIIVNALTEQSKSPAARSMMHVMLMAQLGDLKINRRSDVIPAEEYVASMFKYGESILIRHPLGINSQSSKDLWQAIYPERKLGSEWKKRVSSHGAKVTSEKVIEKKYSGLKAITNAPYAFFTGNNQGIGINISRNNAKLDTAGHLLVYNTENNLGEASLVKLESAGPGSTSVFGHGHGLNVKSNKISAACQIKALSEHTARDAVHIDMRASSSQKLIELIKSFDKWLDLNDSKPEAMREMLDKLAGSKMSLDEIGKFINKYAESASWSDEDSQISIKGNNATTKEIIDVSSSDEMKNLGIRIFSNSNGNYMYYVEDELKLQHVLGPNEANKIKSSQFKWKELKSSIDPSKSNSNVMNSYLDAKIREGKIKPLSYETFLGSAKNEEWLKKKMESAKNEYTKSIAIPGVKLYRSKRSSWGISYTVYGYIITDIETFRNYAKQTLHISDDEIKFVINNQNLWMWTSGSSGLSINNLPVKFRNVLNLVKNMHTNNLKDPKFKGDNLVTEIHPSNVKNDKIIRGI